MDSQTNPTLRELPQPQQIKLVVMQPKSMGNLKKPKYKRGASNTERVNQVLDIAANVLERDDSVDAPNWTDRKSPIKNSKTLLKSRIQVEEARLDQKHSVSLGKMKTLNLELDVLGQPEAPAKVSNPQVVSEPRLKPLQHMFLSPKLPVIHTPFKASKLPGGVIVASEAQPSYFSSRNSHLPKISKGGEKDMSERKLDPETPKIKISGPFFKRSVPNNSGVFQINVSKSKLLSDRSSDEVGLSNLLQMPRFVVTSVLKSQTYYLQKLNKGLNAEDPVVQMEHSGFAEHFAKNFIEMKSLKQDKLLVDYHTKPIQLPPSVHTNLLVLDLDETLVHCVNFDGRSNSGTETVPFRPLGAPASSTPGLVKFNRRPGLEKFLKTMAEHFQIVVFTASDRAYARAVLNQIDPNHYVCKLLCRESCTFTKSGNVVKDLRIFFGKQLQNIILVDNSSKCFYPQVDNGVPILSFIDDERDNELEELSQFLIALKKSGLEIPRSLREYFQLHRYYSANSHTQMAWEIFSSARLM